MADAKGCQDGPPRPSGHHRHDRVIAVQFEPMRQAQVLLHQMCGNLPAHQVARGVLDHRQRHQLRPHVAIRVDHAARGGDDKGFGQQRMHLGPVPRAPFHTQIRRNDDIQRPPVQLFHQPVTCTGFQQELAPAQLCRHGGQKPGRHFGIKILDHPETQGRQGRHVGHRQLCPRFQGCIQNGLRVAAEHSPGRGQPHRACAPVQQNGPKGRLQSRQLLADGRRAGGQTPRGR